MGLTVDRNNDVDAVRRSLDAWKEVLVAVKKVVDWEQNFYPGVIVGVITFKVSEGRIGINLPVTFVFPDSTRMCPLRYLRLLGLGGLSL